MCIVALGNALMVIPPRSLCLRVFVIGRGCDGIRSPEPLAYSLLVGQKSNHTLYSKLDIVEFLVTRSCRKS
jgi:hypothetical protein